MDNTGHSNAYFSVLPEYYKISTLTRLPAGYGRIRIPFFGYDRKYLEQANKDYFGVRPRADVLLYHPHLADSYYCPLLGCNAGPSVDRYALVHHLDRWD